MALPMRSIPIIPNSNRKQKRKEGTRRAEPRFIWRNVCVTTRASLNPEKVAAVVRRRTRRRQGASLPGDRRKGARRRCSSPVPLRACRRHSPVPFRPAWAVG